MPGPVSDACGQNVQECFSSFCHDISKCPPAQLTLRRVPAIKSTLAENQLPHPDPRGRVEAVCTQEVWFQIPGLTLPYTVTPCLPFLTQSRGFCTSPGASKCL